MCLIKLSQVKKKKRVCPKSMEALFYVPMYSTREKCYMLQNTLQVNKTKTRAQVQKLIREGLQVQT